MSIHLPRPLWIGAAAAALLVISVGLQLGLPFYEKQRVIRKVAEEGGKFTTSCFFSDSCLESDIPVWQNVFRDPWRVDLNYTGATDRTVSQLTCFTELESLWLNGTEVTDGGLAHIGKLKNLAGLWLGETHVTDFGLLHLTGLADLTVLVLDYTDVSDAGLKHLKTLTNLKILEIRGTHVTDAGVTHRRRSGWSRSGTMDPSSGGTR